MTCDRRHRPCACAGSAPPIDRRPEASWRVAATDHDAQQHGELSHDASEASEVFSDEILQRCVVQHLFGQELLEPPVLVLQRPQPLGVGRLHTAELGLPLVEGGPADAMPAAQVLGLGPRIMFLQNPNDLLFREPGLARSSISSRSTQLSGGGNSG
jgi:hypothetical protein